ncbi:MAG TPA: hypothetical protein VGK02_00965 [Candidatus Aquicultor sp.]|jgi:hypothetical protein
MRITLESNGKKYRAYSPEEFFKSPENPQTIFNLTKPSRKNHRANDLFDKPRQEQS